VGIVQFRDSRIFPLPLLAGVEKMSMTENGGKKLGPVD
jgi:hypothetical protein